jgi:hypothetical protein
MYWESPISNRTERLYIYINTTRMRAYTHTHTHTQNKNRAVHVDKEVNVTLI